MNIFDRIRDFFSYFRNPFTDIRDFFRNFPNPFSSSRRGPPEPTREEKRQLAAMGVSDEQELRDLIQDGTLQRVFSRSELHEAIASANEATANGKDWRQYFLVLYLLIQNWPGHPATYYIETARSIVDPIAVRFHGYDEPQWTEQEMADWVDGLNPSTRVRVEDTIRELKRDGYSDRQLYIWLCNTRPQLDEAIEKNKITWLHAWRRWQETKDKEEAYKYFKRENEKARGY